MAAALAAANPMLIWYSQEARNYALLVFLAALSFLFFVWLIQGRDARWLWGWATASALALATHYFALALILPEAAWLLWRRREALQAVVLSIGAVGAVGAAVLPLANSQQAKRVAGFTLGDRLLSVSEHFLVGMSVPWPILPGIVIAVLGAALVYALWRAEPAARRVAVVAGGVVVAGALIALVGVPDYLISRNMLKLWPPLAVALGAGLGAARAGVDRTGERGRRVPSRSRPRRVDASARPRFNVQTGAPLAADSTERSGTAYFVGGWRRRSPGRVPRRS